MITTFGPLGWARTGTVVTAHPVVNTTIVMRLTKRGDPDMNAGHSTPGDQDDVDVFGTPAMGKSPADLPIRGRRDDMGRFLTAAMVAVLGSLLLGPTVQGQEEVVCLGKTATILGTAEKDRIKGTEGDDVINGLAGDDVIDGLGGVDLICGAGGGDTIRGGDGADSLAGRAHDDHLTGGGGVGGGR